VETEQLKRSRSINNEGLDGFPSRAGELVKLGLTSFLSFGPLIAIFSGVFYLTLVPIRPRSRGERRSLRTFAGVSLRAPLAFDPRPRRLSTPLLTRP
jgi:hypothetical protein